MPRSILAIFSLLSIFLLSSSPNAIGGSSSSSSNAKEACSGSGNHDLCVSILNTEPKITSAKKLFDLYVAILETAITNGTNTRAHIVAQLEQTRLQPETKKVLQDCAGALKEVVHSFKVVKNSLDLGFQEYSILDYDLALATNDNISPCTDSLAATKVDDQVLLNGVMAANMFGDAARNMNGVLERKARGSS